MRHHTPDTPLAIATLHPQLPRPVQALEDASALAVVFGCEAFELVLCAGHICAQGRDWEGIGGGGDDGGVGGDVVGGEEGGSGHKSSEEEAGDEGVEAHFGGDGDVVGDGWVRGLSKS